VVERTTNIGFLRRVSHDAALLVDTGMIDRIGLVLIAAIRG